MKRFEVRSKIWLEVEGEPLLGEGRERLLLLIEQEGSISAAARAMEIPYRKAWGYLEQMEKRAGFALVERRKGGARGGRTELTCHARRLLGLFDALRDGLQRMVDDRFSEVFESRARDTADVRNGDDEGR